MVDSTSLQEVGRSLEVGTLADEVLAVLGPPTANGPDRSEVLESAATLLREAQEGYGIVELQQPPTHGISMAVENACTYRSAQTAIALVRQPPPQLSAEAVRGAIEQLIESIRTVQKGGKISHADRTFVVNFFDALAEVTLSESSRMLRTYAGQRYREP